MVAKHSTWCLTRSALRQVVENIYCCAVLKSAKPYSSLTDKCFTVQSRLAYKKVLRQYQCNEESIAEVGRQELLTVNEAKALNSQVDKTLVVEKEASSFLSRSQDDFCTVQRWLNHSTQLLEFHELPEG